MAQRPWASQFAVARASVAQTKETDDWKDHVESNELDEDRGASARAGIARHQIVTVVCGTLNANNRNLAQEFSAFMSSTPPSPDENDSGNASGPLVRSASTEPFAGSKRTAADSGEGLSPHDNDPEYHDDHGGNRPKSRARSVRDDDTDSDGALDLASARSGAGSASDACLSLLAAPAANQQSIATRRMSEPSIQEPAAREHAGRYNNMTSPASSPSLARKLGSLHVSPSVSDRLPDLEYLIPADDEPEPCRGPSPSARVLFSGAAAFAGAASASVRPSRSVHRAKSMLSGRPSHSPNAGRPPLPFPIAAAAANITAFPVRVGPVAELAPMVAEPLFAPAPVMAEPLVAPAPAMAEPVPPPLAPAPLAVETANLPPASDDDDDPNGSNSAALAAFDAHLDACRTPSTFEVTSSHDACNRITAYTLANLLENAHAWPESATDIIIYDCRFPYEFEGGHIIGAEHLMVVNAEQHFRQRFFSGANVVGNVHRNVVIIFHCEFSQHRAPTAYVDRHCTPRYRAFRDLDRLLNRYPLLSYPEIYVLEGGYRNFYEAHEHLCEPRNYVPMNHLDFLELGHLHMQQLKRHGRNRSA